MLMEEGVIYILTNAAMPGYIKIGLTRGDVAGRMKSLDTTSVPVPFECFYAARVQDIAFVERQIHQAFDHHRVRSNREFFEIDPERVVAAIKLVEMEDVTPQLRPAETGETKEALDKARERRAAFNFEMVGIPMGAELTFTRNKDIRARVSDNKHVEFNGENTSLSAAAQAALGVSWPAQGPLYWEYEGETLEERRIRMSSL